MDGYNTFDIENENNNSIRMINVVAPKEGMKANPKEPVEAKVYEPKEIKVIKATKAKEALAGKPAVIKEPKYVGVSEAKEAVIGENIKVKKAVAGKEAKVKDAVYVEASKVKGPVEAITSKVKYPVEASTSEVKKPKSVSEAHFKEPIEGKNAVLKEPKLAYASFKDVTSFDEASDTDNNMHFAGDSGAYQSGDLNTNSTVKVELKRPVELKTAPIVDFNEEDAMEVVAPRIRVLDAFRGVRAAEISDSGAAIPHFNEPEDATYDNKKPKDEKPRQVNKEITTGELFNDNKI